MIINMHTELRRGMDGHSENFKKELENVKENQTELKNIITEWGKSLFNKWDWVNWTATLQKNQTGLLSHIIYKNKLKMDERLKCNT